MRHKVQHGQCMQVGHDKLEQQQQLGQLRHDVQLDVSVRPVGNKMKLNFCFLDGVRRVFMAIMLMYVVLSGVANYTHSN